MSIFNHDSCPQTNTQWVNPSRLRGRECLISREDAGSIADPVVGLNADGSIDRAHHVYSLDALVEWARRNNIWPHNRQVINWDLVDSVYRTTRRRRRRRRVPANIATIDDRLIAIREEIRTHPFPVLNDSDDDAFSDDEVSLASSSDHDGHPRYATSALVDAGILEMPRQRVQEEILLVRSQAAVLFRQLASFFSHRTNPETPTWWSSYWYHHRYSDADIANDIDTPRIFGIREVVHTNFHDFRLFMARLLESHEDRDLPEMVVRYWNTHPLNQEDAPDILHAYENSIRQRWNQGDFIDLLYSHPLRHPRS